MEPDPTPPKLRILLVESTKDEMRGQMEPTLKEEGYEVDCAGDEREAVWCIERSRPHMILVTLKGPPGWLLPLAREIRDFGGLTARTPVVVYSHAAAEQGYQEELPNNIFVLAPGDLNELRRKIRRILRRVWHLD